MTRALALAMALSWSAAADEVHGPLPAARRSLALERNACPVPAGAAESLGLVDGRERLRFVRERLARAARRSRIWSWSWAGIFSAAVAGQLALTPALPPEARVDLYLSAGKAAVGLASLAVLPPRVMREQRRLEEAIARAPVGADPCALLAEAERALARAAVDQARGRHPLLISGGLLLNIGVGIVHGLVFERWPSAVAGMFVGSAVGQLLFATKPADTIDDLRRYRLGDLTIPPPARFQWTLAPSVSGVTLGATF